MSKENIANVEYIEGGVTAAKGFTASGVHCGIRKNRTKRDLGLIMSEVRASAAAVYTTNLVKGAPILVDQIFEIIQELHASGVTLLLVEQNAQMALSVANRAYVLETGAISMDGDAKELLHNDDVQKAYLGN